MIRERDYILFRLNVTADFIILVCAVGFSHFIRNGLIGHIFPSAISHRSDLGSYWWLLVSLPLITIGILTYRGYYQFFRVHNPARISFSILISVFGASLSTMIIAFAVWERNTSDALNRLISGEFVSRAVLLIYPFIAFTLILLKTYLLRRILSRRRFNQTDSRTILLVGGNFPALTRMINTIKFHPYWGFEIIGFVSDATDLPGEIESIFNWGKNDQFYKVIERNAIDEIVFLAEGQNWDTIVSLMRGAEEMGIRSHFPLNNMISSVARPTIEYFGSLPLLSLNPVREIGFSLFVKFVFDRVVALGLLILLFPVFSIIALAIKLSSKNFSDPVFYGQVRCGLHGKQFTLWKFRSMHIDADARLDELKTLNEMSGPVFKIKNDPRVTPLGRWLRKTSLDEIPQFWNVLKGEMSLVGPRPPLPSEVENYDRWQRRRLSMRPGITCIWQVSGRNNVPFETWMKQDLEYIDNWSLTLDFKILFRTLYVVTTGHGAM